MDVELLIDQLKKKNASALETLYTQYGRSISGVVFSIVRDDAIAEELTQDIFIKVWENAASYDSSKGRFFTWLLNIARNAAIDKTRSKAFRNSRKNVDVGLFSDILETRDSLDSHTDTIGIAAFVKKLADKCRELIDALYFKGFTQKETAEQLDIPIGTVKTRNRSCLNELRNMMED